MTGAGVRVEGWLGPSTEAAGPTHYRYTHHGYRVLTMAVPTTATFTTATLTMARHRWLGGVGYTVVHPLAQRRVPG